MTKRYARYLSGLSGLALLSSPAFAQDTASADMDEIAFEEIIVTAQRREQRLMDVPMAIAAITGSELEERGIETIQDLSFAVPGLTMREDGPGSYQIFMRGVANAHGGGALVAVYQDEVPMVLTGYDVLPTRTLDLARVEVLKGPQGTLYGQGAVAGAVRYITNDPDLTEFGGNISTELWSVASGELGFDATGVVNVAVVKDKFALRLVGNVRTGGGWQDQPEAGIENGNDEELTNIRLKARWKPTDALDMVATFISYHAEYELGQGYEQPDRTVYVAIDPAKAQIPKIWDYELYNLEINYDFGFASLMSSTSYTDMNHQYPFSYYGGPETIYQGIYFGNDARYVPGDQFSQEIRLSSNGDGPLQWTIGGFYTDMKRSLTALYEYEYGGFLVENQEYYSGNTSETISVFGDVSYQITERLQVGAGIRYFEDEQTETTGFEPDAVLQEGKFDSVDPRFYLSYAASDDLNIYASAAKGFRSGGFNVAGLPAYDPESLWSYELGLKGTVADGALYFDIAGYYTKYNDMLRRGLLFLGTDLGLQQLVSNVAAAEVKGIEASFAWKVTDALTINGSGTVINAEVTEVNAEDAGNLVGDPIDYVPDFSFTLGAHYDFNWSDDMPGFLRVNYNYRDRLPYVDLTSFPVENTPQYSDSIGLLDARLGLTRDSWTVELYAQNLTNVNKYIDPYHGWNQANRTRPRTVGVRVGFDF